MSLQLIRTDSTNTDFIRLVAELTAALAVLDGEEHAFYAQYSTIENIRFVVVAYLEQVPVGCGALRAYDESQMEIKRMYTRPSHRGKGIASAILNELEAWARELSFETCILETGLRQPEAISLYEKYGYARISNYEPYTHMNNSVCYEKRINRSDARSSE